MLILCPFCGSKPFFCHPVCVFAVLAAEWQLLGDEWRGRICRFQAGLEVPSQGRNPEGAKRRTPGRTGCVDLPRSEVLPADGTCGEA